MNDVLSSTVPKQEAEPEKTLTQLFTDMQHLNELMRQDQVVIDRLKAETDLLRVETRAILARLGATL